MKNKKEQFAAAGTKGAASVALALWIGGSGAMGLVARGSATGAAPERQVTTVQSKFYCNIKALTPEERARHEQLSKKLLAERTQIVELEKGYELQFNPKSVSIAELSAWVTAESKCCPFFDFHIDLEKEGTLLCLRLTGEEGIKAFIRSEFGLK